MLRLVAQPSEFFMITVTTRCRAAAKAEGELIRRKAADEAAELAAKEAAWRAKAKEMNAATKASNDTLLAFRAAERERDNQLEAAVEGEEQGHFGGAVSRQRPWAPGWGGLDGPCCSLLCKTVHSQLSRYPFHLTCLCCCCCHCCCM